MKLVRASQLVDESVSHDASLMKRVWLRRGDAPCLGQFATTVIGPGKSVPAHSHADMCEVFLISAGRGEFEIDGQRVVLQAGDCLVVHAGETHAVANPNDEPLTLTYFALVP